MIYYETETLLGLLVSVMTYNAFQLRPPFGFSNMLAEKNKTRHYTNLYATLVNHIVIPRNLGFFITISIYIEYQHK